MAENATKRGAKDASATKLKNYRATSPIFTILETIQRALTASGARRITFDYDAGGQAVAIEFQLIGNEKQLQVFRLPARLQAVEPLVISAYQAAGRRPPQGEELRQQVYRTGWANIRDWITAQMALLATGMVKAEEIFLPYLLLEGPAGAPMTYYEAFALYQTLPSSKVTVLEEAR